MDPYQDWQLNTTFNPYNQTFILVLPDGKTAFPAALTDIGLLNSTICQQALIFGFQIGVSGLLLLIMLLMTKRDKRRSAVFLLNAVALVAIFVRNVIYAAMFNTVLFNFYNWELHYYPAGPALTHALVLSAATEALNIPIDVAIYASLIVQIYIVCCTLADNVKFGLMIVSTIVGTLAVTVRLALAILNIKWNIFGISNTTMAQFETLQRLAKANAGITVATIAFFSLIFVAKLAFAIRLRRKLNMKQFGPMQIIFVMGCQTMFIPLIFQIVSFYVAKGTKLSSLVPLAVAVFLPLSGMWASAQTQNDKLVRSDPRFHRALAVGASAISGSTHHKPYGSTKDSGTDNTTLIDDDEDDSTVPYQGRSMSSARARNMPEMHVLDDVETERYKNGVVVDRTYSVRSD